MSMNLQQLDLNLLLALDRLLARESVTAAARDLGITQPAMSRTLERLREAFGDPLFVRAGRGIRPTPRAQALSAPLAALLGQVRQLFDPSEGFDPAQARGELSIAMGDENVQTLGAAIFNELQRSAPEVDLRIRRIGIESIEHGRSGLLDLAITPQLAALPPRARGPELGELHSRKLYTRRFVVAWCPSHPRAAPDLDAYCAAKHALVSFEGGGVGFVDDLLSAMGRRRRVAASAPSFPGVAALLRGTDLLATMPEECAVGLMCAPPPLSLPEIPMLLLWHPRQALDARHRFLRERVAAAVSQATSAA